MVVHIEAADGAAGDEGKAMTDFNTLSFKPHPNWDGVQATQFYPNGYGVSVIQSSHSYGGDKGLFELAVMKGSAENHELCYDTPVTSDVEGHLSPEDVTDLMQKVAELPATDQ